MNELVNKTSGKIALVGMLAALALILGVVEAAVPLTFIPVPGIKLGLSNAAVLFAVYYLGKGEGLAVLTVKVVLSAVLYAGINGFIYSACGALLSFLTVCLLCRLKCFTVTGVSAAAGAAHNIGQLAAALFMLKSGALIYYLPLLIAAGCITGTVTGLLTAFAVKRLDNIKTENPII